MNFNKFVDSFENLEISRINIKGFSDMYETDLSIFEQNCGEISVSKFYASCIKKYYCEVLKYPAKEAEVDFKELLLESSPNLALYPDIKSILKKWLVYIDCNVNVDQIFEIFEFNDEDCYVSLFTEDDFFLSLVISTNKYYLILASC